LAKCKIINSFNLKKINDSLHVAGSRCEVLENTTLTERKASVVGVIQRVGIVRIHQGCINMDGNIGLVGAGFIYNFHAVDHDKRGDIDPHWHPQALRTGQRRPAIRS
jgi:hypothetical protein